MVLKVPLVPRASSGVLRVLPVAWRSPLPPGLPPDVPDWAMHFGWLKAFYDGQSEFVFIGVEGLRGGNGFSNVGQLPVIASESQCDLILLGSVRDLYANLDDKMKFVRNCIVQDVRVIAIEDEVDTAMHGWDIAMQRAHLLGGLKFDLLTADS